MKNKSLQAGRKDVRQLVTGLLMLVVIVCMVGSGESVERVALSLLLTACVLTGNWCGLWVSPRGWYREIALRRAILRGDISGWYQPLVRGESRQIMGCEMLARWRLRNGKVCAAGEFIPLAEAAGLSVLISRLMMRQARRELRDMKDVLPEGFRLSLNISGAHAGVRGFAGECLRLQRQLSAVRGTLMIEITERDDFTRVDNGVALLNILREAGVIILLDDFATGFSSVTWLDKLPVDGVKLDRHYVNQAVRGGKKHHTEPVAALIIRVAHLMNLEVVAEGVETQEQHEWLLTKGVIWQQGYWFAPAMSCARLYTVLEQAVDTGKNLPATRRQ